MGDVGGLRNFQRLLCAIANASQLAADAYKLLIFYDVAGMRKQQYLDRRTEVILMTSLTCQIYCFSLLEVSSLTIRQL
jgi:hypothetical protein